MPVRTSQATWRGNLKDGYGSMRVGSGAYEGPYSFKSRFAEGDGTNPEELIAAAHAGCFSMALAADLAQAGFVPRQVHTEAKVHLDSRDGGFAITRIDLDTQAEVAGIDGAAFKQLAETTKTHCPVSRALAAVDITLTAKLKRA